MLIKIFIHKDQLYNFLIDKEPVKLINEIIHDDYFEMNINYKKLEINEYKSYMTVEIRKNVLSKLLRKIFKKDKRGRI